MNALIFLMVIIITVTIAIDIPRNNSDTSRERSGLSIYTDTLTGCQYLSTWAGLTLRVDKNNKPICPKDSIHNEIKIKSNHI